MEKWGENIFMDNEEKCEEDIKLFADMEREALSPKGREFFERMRDKEFGEFAPSADLIMDEDDNEEGIFIVRYYFDEYKLGQISRTHPTVYREYTQSLADLLTKDMFPFLYRHITLLQWLVERDFAGIRYNGNFALN